MKTKKVNHIVAPVRIGLWGCGKRTRSLVEDAVSRGLAKVVCCYDLNTAAAEKLAQDYGASVVASEAGILDNEDADAFLICLYPGFHGEALLKALPIGKPIYVEKPIATNWRDFENVKRAARAYDTKVQVGLAYRYIPIFHCLTELVQNGKIGQLVSVAINWFAYLEPLHELSGRLDDWHFREDTGGELIQHFCHVFDWFRELGGEMSEISAMSNHTVHAGLPIEDTWDINLRYRSGALVNFHSSENNPRRTELGWIEGSEGALEWEWSAPSYIRFFDRRRSKSEGFAEVPIADPDYTPLTHGFVRFLQSVIEKTPTDINIWDGLWASYIPLMARRSAERRQTLKLDDLAGI